jgi:hypothetical protein
MKTKNLALGFAAALFAIGGAFASNAIVLGKYVKAPTCTPIVDVECGAAGPRACAVIINGTTYSPVYQDAVCTLPVTTALTSPIPTQFED